MTLTYVPTPPTCQQHTLAAWFKDLNSFCVEEVLVSEVFNRVPLLLARLQLFVLLERV